MVEGECSDNAPSLLLEGKFPNLNFSPSTKKTTEYSFKLFLPIDMYTDIRERSLIIGGGAVNLGGGPGFFGLPFGEGHMFLSLR